MKTRILTAILILAVTIPTFIFSGYIIYPIVLSLLSVVSVYELLRVFGFGKNAVIAVPSYALAFGLPLSAYFASGNTSEYFLICSAFVYAYMLYLFMLAVLSKGKIKFSQLAKVFCAIAYVALAFASLSVIRYIENGAYCFGIVFICSWVSDVCALFAGTLFGKHKLIPEISPKKTVEGLIGGVVFGTLAMLLYGFILDMVVDTITVNYLMLGAMGLVLSLIAQVGDLIASTIKREEGVKDYGSLLPGHGGITDRFDSIYAISLLTLIICVIFPPIV